MKPITYALKTITFAVLLSVAAPCVAQTSGTGPVSTSDILAWGQPNKLTAVDALAFQYLYADSLIAGAITLQSVACADGSPAACTMRLTDSMVAAINNLVGVHQLTVTAKNVSTGETSPPSAPFALTILAPAPPPPPPPPPLPTPSGCSNGTTILAKGSLWTFTVRTNTKSSYTNYVLGLGGWTLLQSRSSNGGNWLLQFRCDR